METNDQGLTRSEKKFFILLGIILTFVMGVFTISTFSRNERVLDREISITNKEKNRQLNEDEIAKFDVSLVEDNVNNNVEYVTNVVSSEKKENKSVKVLNSKKNQNKEETVGFLEWDFPKNIVTEAMAGDKITINRNIVTKDGNTAYAQVTVRRLIIDTYMIQDISNNTLELQEGIYKYYYTYANVTKELVLTVKANLNLKSVNFPSIVDTENINKEDLTNYNNMISNTKITASSNNIDLRVSTSLLVKELPLYITLDKDLKGASVSSNTYGIRLNKTSPELYRKLNDDELLLWINPSVIGSNSQSEIELVINGIKYIFTLNINKTNKLDKDSNEKEINNPMPINSKDKINNNAQNFIEKINRKLS